MYAIKRDGAWQELRGAFTIGEGVDAIHYPAEWPAAVSAGDRAAVGIVEIVEPAPPAAGTMVLGSILTGDTVPTRVWQVAQPTLEEAKAQQMRAADAKLASVMAGTCTTSIGVVACDAIAQMHILTKVVDALIAKINGTPFARAWPLVNMTLSAPMDADQMIAFGQEVQAHVEPSIDASTAAKRAIAAAATVTDVQAVDVTAGYPDA